MNTYLLQSFLLMFGTTMPSRQVNLSDVPIDFSDGLRRKVRRNRIRDNPKENSLGWLSMHISHCKIMV